MIKNFTVSPRDMRIKSIKYLIKVKEMVLVG